MFKRFGFGLGAAALIFASLALYGWFGVDYKNTRDLLHDLDSGTDVVGKTVMVDVKRYKFTGLVYYFQPAPDLDFVSPNNPEFREGDSQVVEITNVQQVFDRYIVGYRVEGEEEQDVTYSSKRHATTQWEVSESQRNGYEFEIYRNLVSRRTGK